MRTLGTARSTWALRGGTHARSRRSTAALTLEVSTARSARSSTTELRSLRAFATEVLALGSGSRGSSAIGLTTELWGTNADTSLLGGARCLTLVRSSKGFALLRSA